MKACVYADLEKVEVVDIDLPSAGPDEVLIKVARAGICGTDLHIFLGHMDQRVTKPLVMGHEMCGEIVEAPDGADYQVGERVVVEPTVFCGMCAACRRGNTHVCQNLNFLGIDSAGAFQELWNAPVDRLHRIPRELSDNAAAMIEPLAVAVHDVRRAQVELGDQAVVIGGGPIQAVLRSKTNTSDLRSASVIDFMFGFCLLYRAFLSSFPLSTTWVFLGLLAGRELALRFRQLEQTTVFTNQAHGSLAKVIGGDIGKASVGLVVSLLIAFGIQPLINWSVL